ENLRICFKAYAVTSNLAQNPMEGVAGPNKWIDDQYVSGALALGHDRSYVLANGVGQPVVRTLDGCPSKEPDPTCIPLCRRHSIDRNILSIGIAIDAILLYLPQIQHGVAFWPKQQEVTVVSQTPILHEPRSLCCSQKLLRDAGLHGAPRNLGVF